MKKAVCILLAVCFILLPVSAENISARSAVVMDAFSGEIVYEKASDLVMPPASTTKLLTAYVAVNLCPLEREMTVSQDMVSTEGSMMYLRVGERITLRELLYGLLLCSGNDAALAIARLVCGSVEGFVGQMNLFATELGMTSSHFENPHGLPSKDHYTTAADLARLMAAFSKNGILMEISGTREHIGSGRTLINHNKLLWQYDAVDGGKTGYTKEAGRCLVTTAVKNGRRLVAVTLNASDDWNDHKKLYEAAFSRYSETVTLPAGIELDVVGSALERVPVVFETADIRLTPQELEKAQTVVYMPHFAYAPVKAGENIGYISILIDGKELSRILLYTDKNADTAARTYGKRI